MSGGFGKKSPIIKQLMKKAGLSFNPAEHVLSGTELRDTGVLRLQIEGAAKAGKSRLLLDIVRHMHEVMKLEIEEILMCVIDFDKDGLHYLLQTEILPRKYHNCIRYWKVDLASHPMLEAYAALDHFETLLEEHRKRTSFMGLMAIENTGTAWTECQGDYTKIMYGKSMVEMLMEAKLRAEQKGNITSPALNQLHDYKIINPFWLDFANAVTMGNYHMIWTCYQNTRQVEEANGEKTDRICGQGQKDNDGKVDWIVVLYKKKGQYLATFRGIRGIGGNTTIANPSFTKIIRNIYSIMEKEVKLRYKKQNLGEPPKIDFYWLDERAKSPVPQSLDIVPKSKPVIKKLAKEAEEASKKPVKEVTVNEDDEFVIEI